MISLEDDTAKLTFGELLRETYGASKLKASIWIDVCVVNLIIGWRIDDADLACLQEVIDDDDMLLVGSNLNEVRSNCWVHRGRIIETLRVVDVRNVELGDMVAGGSGKVGEFAVFGDIRENCYIVGGKRTKIIK